MTSLSNANTSGTTPSGRASERRVRGLIVMPLAEQRGGAELALVDLLRHSAKGPIEWSVVFFEDGAMVQQAIEFGIAARVVLPGRLRQPHRFMGTVLKLARILRREKFDLVLSWMGKPHLYAGPAALLARVPAFWFQHGRPSPPNFIDRLTAVIPARGILACSRISAQAQSRLNASRNVRAVHPGVDLDRFDPGQLPSASDARRQLGLPGGVPIVGIIGRLQRWKGIHTVIDAMPAVRKEFPDVHCVVVGGEHSLEPDYPGSLRRRIEELRLTDCVHMVGQQRNVPLWTQAMDIVVHASGGEPFGIVVLEAMALGKPMVAGDFGGPTEIITDGVDGLLTPYEDAPALSAAILRYLRDPTWAAGVGRAARDRAMTFST
ncbi:MAG TPA: glycosyltransferase, partial [Tepidisphaeraceae bacterium]|nr:glycosyltransferase [Tepidisphaeraceae bacterium]